MKRVTGIGGVVFFRAENPTALAECYEKHSGISFGGKTYANVPSNGQDASGTAFSLFDADTKYFELSEKQFMINLRVENLAELLKFLRAEGVRLFDETEDGDYGKFGWILDVENNKIELWEPK